MSQLFNPSSIKKALKNTILFYWNFAPLIGIGFCIDWFVPKESAPPQKIIHVYFPFIILSWWITDIPRGVSKRVLTK